MRIEIENHELAARLQRQMDAIGTSSTDEVLTYLLHSREEADRWLLENKAFVQEKIKRGVDQIERGEGIPYDKAKDYLARLKAEGE